LVLGRSKTQPKLTHLQINDYGSNLNGVFNIFQEVLVVGVGNRILRFDTTKVGRGKTYSADEPLQCPVDKLIDGIQFVGKHDGEITDLSMCQWMTTRLVSASVDGTVSFYRYHLSNFI